MRLLLLLLLLLLLKRSLADTLFRRYLMMNRPVVVRNLNGQSPAWDAYSLEGLTDKFAFMKVESDTFSPSEPRFVL